MKVKVRRKLNYLPRRLTCKRGPWHPQTTPSSCFRRDHYTDFEHPTKFYEDVAMTVQANI